MTQPVSPQIVEFWNKFKHSELISGAWDGMRWEELPIVCQLRFAEMFTPPHLDTVAAMAKFHDLYNSSERFVKAVEAILPDYEASLQETQRLRGEVDRISQDRDAKQKLLLEALGHKQYLLDSMLDIEEKSRRGGQSYEPAINALAVTAIETAGR